MIRIGDMTDNFVFQAPSGSPVTWTTIFSCKGLYKGLASKESIAAMASNSTVTGTVRIWWKPVKIRSNWRIVANGTTILSISGPAIDTKYPGEGRYWVLKVVEVG